MWIKLLSSYRRGGRRGDIIEVDAGEGNALICRGVAEVERLDVVGKDTVQACVLSRVELGAKKKGEKKKPGKGKRDGGS